MEKGDASPERIEVHVATMIVEHLHEGDKFSDLSETYVIVNELMFVVITFLRGVALMTLSNVKTTRLNTSTISSWVNTML